jgi:predicted metal-dependent HD superfamily phosphohydrolase
MDALPDSEQIRSIPMLNTIEPAQIEKLLANSSKLSFQDKAILFHKGDEADNLFLVLGGEVEVIIEDGAVTHKVSILGHGQLFGELALLNNISRNATLRACGNLEVLKIDAETFFEILRTNPGVALAMMQQLADKLARSHEYAAELKRQILQLQKSHLTFRSSKNLELTSDQDRFLSLWKRNLLQGAPDHALEIYKFLINAYDQNQRVYHTRQHIEDCLTLFDRIQPRLENPDALELAIWYHDAIYEIGARDNERQSADLFLRHARDVFDQDLCGIVEKHVMATLHRGDLMPHIDSGYMVDIDLASFGKPWDMFINDAEKVRMEMPHIPDHLFYPSQFAFQNTLLDRRQFFQSDYFFERYEETARYNLAEYSKLIRRITDDASLPA